MQRCAASGCGHRPRGQSQLKSWGIQAGRMGRDEEQHRGFSEWSIGRMRSAHHGKPEHEQAWQAA